MNLSQQYFDMNMTIFLRIVKLPVIPADTRYESSSKLFNSSIKEFAAWTTDDLNNIDEEMCPRYTNIVSLTDSNSVDCDPAEIVVKVQVINT